MVQFRLMIVLPLVIGVLQVCTANPISSEEESNLAKLFSPDEIQRANSVGITVERLVEGRSDGFTFEEMIKLHELRKTTITNKEPSSYATFEHMKNVCEILATEQKILKDLTSAQEAKLSDMDKVIDHLVGRRDPFDFIRSNICGYLSQPDVLDMEANSFGLPLMDYLEMLFFKSNAEQVSTSAEHVIVAKQSCLRKNREENEEAVLGKSTFNGELPDADLVGFVEQWNAFETSNTLKSLENVCDFLQTKDHTKDECLVATATPINGPIDE